MKPISRFLHNYNKRKEQLYRNGIFGYLFNSSGYVLILVLLIVTLLASLVSDFTSVAQTSIGYTIKINERIKAGVLARSGFELSKYLLLADKSGLAGTLQSQLTGKKTDKNTDSYFDIWALDLPELDFSQEEIKDGNKIIQKKLFQSLKISIDDENSKINLSVLANEVVDQTKYYGILQNFFTNFGLPMDLADVAKDWVDIDDSRSPYGAESGDFYQSLVHPYKAKNAAMDSLDEMLMMKGITPEIYYGLGGGTESSQLKFVDNNKGKISLSMDKLVQMTDKTRDELKDKTPKQIDRSTIARESDRKLSTYLRAHGYRKDWTHKYNKININTATYRVLSALTDKMTDDIVTDVISRRMIEPYKKVDELKDIIDDPTLRQHCLSVQSYIFKITSTATVGKTTVKVTVIFNRDNQKIYYWSED